MFSLFYNSLELPFLVRPSEKAPSASMGD